MAETRNLPTRPTPADGPEPVDLRAGRTPLRDNPRLILVFILGLLAALAAMVGLADRSAQLSPGFLSEVVLYALVAADVTILVALVFVLARNIIKLVVERRRALPFARFRAKLVAVLLGLTLIPTILVLIVGSELIRNSATRWFSAPIDDVLTSAREIASDYYGDREDAMARHAERLAGALSGQDLAAARVSAIRDLIAPEVTERRVGMVEVYRILPDTDPPVVRPVVDVADPLLPRGYPRATADRLATRAAAEAAATRLLEPLRSGGELVRVATVIPGPTPGAPDAGVVVVSDYLSGELAHHARRIVDAYEGYQQLRVLRRPLEGVYLSFFLMVTLLILVSATWMGLYLAKRITRPIRLLAEGAREIGAGHLDHRIEPETRDEFGALVEAFNAMAGELAVSQRRLERSRHELERRNLEAVGRRRYIETILERVATGVVSIDAEGRVSTMNPAALRLLGLDSSAIGQPSDTVFSRPDLEPIAALLWRAARPSADPDGRELALLRDDQEVHLAVAATPVGGEEGFEGTVLVLDDVTPLIRAQKVAAWRDVARRLAHEIKNPLTPIQLCAERLRRHFTGAAEPARTLVDECSRTIVGEVESLKALVDEFSQFARMPPPRTVPTDVHQLLRETLALYDGLFRGIRLEPRFAASLPAVRVDPEQFRRVIINLVDNAAEALGATGGQRAAGAATGVITVATEHDATNGVVRLVVADTGPGIPPGDRAKLFMPYYSTKRRGSGLGLAIVRRIVVEHGGSIEVGDNPPRGTRFTIELPSDNVAIVEDGHSRRAARSDVALQS